MAGCGTQCCSLVDVVVCSQRWDSFFEAFSHLNDSMTLCKRKWLRAVTSPMGVWRYCSLVRTSKETCKYRKRHSKKAESTCWARTISDLEIVTKSDVLDCRSCLALCVLSRSWALGYPCLWLTKQSWNQAHTVPYHCRGMQQCRPGSHPLPLVFQNFWHCLLLLRATEASTENKRACGWNQWDLLWQKFGIYEKHVAILHTARREVFKNLNKEFYPPTSFERKLFLCVTRTYRFVLISNISQKIFPQQSEPEHHL